MNRNLSIVASIILLLLGAGIFYVKWNTHTANPNPSTPVEQSINTPNISKEEADYRRRVEEEGAKQLKTRDQIIADLEIANKAIGSLNPNQCTDIVNEETKKMCLEQSAEALALKEKNIAGCDQIADTVKKDTCKDKVYIIQARDKSDKLICDMIGQDELRKKCVEEVEAKLYQANRGKNASGNTIQPDCSTYSDSGVVAQCNYDSQNQKDYKLIYSAFSKEDANLCKDIVSKKLQQDCLNGILLAQAKNTLTVSKCDKISDDTVKIRCRTTITGLIDAKYFQDAIKNKDLETCVKIDDERQRDICVDKIRLCEVVQLHKGTECPEFHDPSLLEICKKSLGTN